MRLMETKTVLSARARLVRLASGATAMAAATLMAASFHVVPTMAAESEAGVPAVQTAVLRSADAPIPMDAPIPAVAPVTTVQTLAKPAVAPAAPVSATSPVAPVAVVFAAPYATPEAAPVALPALQSLPAVAPPSPVAAPASSAVAPVAPAATPAVPAVAPVTPTAPEVAPVAPAASADKEKNKKKSSYAYRRTGPDGNKVVIINGKVRALTPEEQQGEIEKAMEQFKNGDFAKNMADLQQEMAKLKIKYTFDSPEFREKMEAAQREFAQSALVDNVALQARIQAMMKNFDIQNMNIGHCKDGAVKDKEKEKQKKSEDPQIQ